MKLFRTIGFADPLLHGYISSSSIYHGQLDRVPLPEYFRHIESRYDGFPAESDLATVQKTARGYSQIPSSIHPYCKVLRCGGLQPLTQGTTFLSYGFPHLLSILHNIENRQSARPRKTAFEGLSPLTSVLMRDAARTEFTIGAKIPGFSFSKNLWRCPVTSHAMLGRFCFFLCVLLSFDC